MKTLLLLLSLITTNAQADVGSGAIIGIAKCVRISIDVATTGDYDHSGFKKVNDPTPPPPAQCSSEAPGEQAEDVCENISGGLPAQLQFLHFRLIGFPAICTAIYLCCNETSEPY